MKKKLLTAVVIALGLSSVAACGKGNDANGDKLATIKEIYDANYALSEKMENGTELDFNVKMDLSAKSALLAAYMGASGEEIGYSFDLNGEMTKEVQHLAGTVDVKLGDETEAEDYETWVADGKTYTYMPGFEMWSVSAGDSFSSFLGTAENADQTEVNKVLDEIQKGIDDESNKDVTLELKNGKYELNYKFALSKLADVEGLNTYLSQVGLSADTFKSLEGCIVISATFDAETLLISSLEISIDDKAKEDIKNVMATMIPVEITECSIKCEFKYAENSTLAVPNDVVDNAQEISEDYTDEDGYSDGLGNEEEE